MMARRINFLGGKSALVTLFGSPAHSSSRYTKLNKSPLRKYLCLGLSEVLTKNFCAGTSIESGSMCKGDDLHDYCHKSAMLSPNARARKERIFSTAVRPKKGEKKKKGSAR